HEVLKRESLHADVALAAYVEKWDGVAHCSQIPVVEDDLIAPASDAGVAAAAARWNAESVGLEGNIVAGRARDAERQPLVVSSGHKVNGGTSRRSVHCLLD